MLTIILILVIVVILASCWRHMADGSDRFKSSRLLL